jgi:hypothetical protein
LREEASELFAAVTEAPPVCRVNNPDETVRGLKVVLKSFRFKERKRAVAWFSTHQG